MALRASTPWLPQAALARWQATSAGDVQSWFEGLLARMVCTGGRVPELLVDLGLCALGDIAACVAAQLAAGPLAHDGLRMDLDADLSLLANRLALDEALALSDGVASHAWVGDMDALHGDVAARLVAAGREDEALAVLSRIDWHRSLLAWIETHGDAVQPDRRTRLFAAAGRLIATTHLPAEYHVELYAQLAVLAGDRAWLSRAREVLAALPAEAIAATPDLPHPRESLALALARLGDPAGALVEIEQLEPRERWSARIGLLPWLPDRAAAIEALIEDIDRLDVSWGWLVEVAPETSERALRTILAMDASRRGEELAGVAKYLRGAPAREACALLLARAGAAATGSRAWVDAWEAALDTATAAGCEDAIDEAARCALIDALLELPDVDLWLEAAPYVPPSRAHAVLATAIGGLEVADHYTTRERWIALGLPLLARVPVEQADRFLAQAATQLPRTGIDGKSLATFAAWSPAQQQSIVLGRLAQHQLEFLPRNVIRPWLVGLAYALPPRLWPDWDGWIDADVLARLREPELVDIEVPEVEPPADGAWPTVDQVVRLVVMHGEESTRVATGLIAALRRASRRV